MKMIQPSNIHRNKSTWATLATGVLAVLTCATHAPGQSADALIDKLVDKGILTTKEAKDLRAEADADFRKAYQVKSGMPDWVTSFKLNGDLRLRYDGIYSDNPALVERHRARYRLRFGATAVMMDKFEAGFRLMSGEGSSIAGVSDPISGNTTFDNGGAKKGIFIDMAYGKWTAINNADWSATFIGGKMENPFVFSDIVFDPDYTPEGLAMQAGYNFNHDHALKFNAGVFTLDELSGSSHDPYMMGAQLRFESKWSPKLHSSMGVALLNIARKDALVVTGNAVNNFNNTVPNQNRGNTRLPTGAATIFGTNGLASNFNPIVADASVTYTLDKFPGYNGAFPIKVGGDFVYNPAISSKNKGFSGGVTFGKSGKKGLWDLSYRYKYLGADSWYEELVDSDFGAFYQTGLPNGASGTGYGPGTNLRGHVIRMGYSPADALTFNVTYYLAKTITTPQPSVTSELGRLQVDATFKF